MTTENNKIIAEFMGLEITKDKVIVPEMFQVEEHPFHLLKWIDDFREVDNLLPNSLNNLHFHSDWNWLMEVVEKIESINEANDEFYSDYSFTVTNFIQNWTAGFISRENVEIVNVEGLTKIEAVYNACLEFIKYYNEQTI